MKDISTMLIAAWKLRKIPFGDKLIVVRYKIFDKDLGTRKLVTKAVTRKEVYDLIEKYGMEVEVIA